MTPSEITRTLCLITSETFQKTRYFPISIIAQLTGLSRETIYQARAGKGLTQRVTALLGPILKDILAGKLQTYRGHRKWHVRQAEKLERQFLGQWPNSDVTLPEVDGLRNRAVRERALTRSPTTIK